MKSIDVTLQRTYLTKNCKKNIVGHPAKLSNILGRTYVFIKSILLSYNFYSKIRKALVLKGIFFETKNGCVLTCRISRL